MQFIQLETVSKHLQVGVPLPFNVRQSDRTLLLARGQVLRSEQQLEALFERGMLVDIDELLTPRERVLQAAPERLPMRWEKTIEQIAQVLLEVPAVGFDGVLDDVAQPLVALIERDADLAIFQVLRQHGSALSQYGVNHSIHCAIAAFLAARRLVWEPAAVARAFKAALTMNISMLDLQGRLATQVSPLTTGQRTAIHDHPQRSVQMLRLAGIADAAWLEAVEQHHEVEDGSGYPSGLQAVSPLAALLRQCDIYTAKLSPRSSREALTADVAARRLYTMSREDPMAMALIKEFGLYPPGSFVRLASGETGMVVRRGSGIQTPIVAAMTDRRGASLAEPVRRDTASPEHAIVAALGASPARAAMAPRALRVAAAA